MKFDLSTLLSAADLGKRIAKIAKVGASLQAEIHEIAVQTLGHIAAHGDTTLFTRLLDSLPNGQRVKALAFWGGHFSGGNLTATYEKDAGWSVKLKKGWTAAEGLAVTRVADPAALPFLLLYLLAALWLVRRAMVPRCRRGSRSSLGLGVAGGLLRLLGVVATLTLGLLVAVAKTAGRSTFHSGARF